MGDNVQLSENIGTGSILAAASLSFSGDDSAMVQVIGCSILSGSEDSWTLSQMVGGAGAVASGVQRVTLASNDPAVAALDSIKTAVEGTLTSSITSIGSVVDANNSTTTPLGGGTTYTGTGTDLLGYSAVCITIYANVDSAASGMKFQFSSNGSNWDDIYSFTLNISESPTRRFQFPVTAQYFRIVYTNGGGAQSAFRVQTILHTATPLTTIHRLGDDLSPDRSATIVKSAIFAQKAGSGDLTAVDATSSGNLKISVQEVSDGLDVGAGNAGSETQRVSIATNDVNLSAIKTAVQLSDDAILADGGAPSKSALTGGRYDATPRTITDTKQGALAITPQGAAHVAAAGQSSFIYDGDTKCTIKRDAVLCSTGTVTIAAAPTTTKKIRVLAISIIATSVTETKVYLKTTTNDILGDSTNSIPMATDADGDNIAGFTWGWNPGGWFETVTTDEALSIVLSTANDVLVAITWIEVD